MRWILMALGIGWLGLGGPADAQSGLQLSSVLGGTGSTLSPEIRERIRAPVPGALEGQPRRPMILDDPSMDLDRFMATRTYTGPQGPFQQMARAAARRHGIPEDLFLRLVTVESNWQPRAVSRAGAIGLAQLMPGTAAYLRVDPYDPQQNLDGGARYLREQYQRFGNWRLALAAYNAGPGAVLRFGGIPPYRETQTYVRLILGS